MNGYRNVMWCVLTSPCVLRESEQRAIGHARSLEGTLFSPPTVEIVLMTPAMPVVNLSICCRPLKKGWLTANSNSYGIEVGPLVSCLSACSHQSCLAVV